MRKISNLKTHIVVIVCITGFLFACSKENKTNSISRVQKIVDDSEPINDAKLLKHFLSKAKSYYAQNGGTEANELKKQTSNKKCEVSLENSSLQVVKGGAFYNAFKKRVLVMGMLYKRGEEAEYQISTASAFPISKDGICVTNYHVFKSYDRSKPSEYETMFVMDYDGEVYPVVEVLAASKQDDLAIFRINCGNMEMLPLILGNNLPAGEDVNLISHPNRRLYSYTRGNINRKYIKSGTTKIRQCISAEFAKGSSGAPILDNCGNVVGVVAGTQNINYNSKPETYQMTIREIIPVSRIKKLIQ